MQISPYIQNKIIHQGTVKGDIIQVKTTDKRHYAGLSAPKDLSPDQGFANALVQAVEKVNDTQIDAQKITQKMISDPQSVNMHNVMIALEKARMSIAFAKNVTDLGVKTYRQLVNMR